MLLNPNGFVRLFQESDLLTLFMRNVPISLFPTGKTCPYFSFTCGDGSCVSMSTVCDGETDCKSGEDESNCGKDSTMNGIAICSFCLMV